MKQMAFGIFLSILALSQVSAARELCDIPATCVARTKALANNPIWTGPSKASVANLADDVKNHVLLCEGGWFFGRKAKIEFLESDMFSLQNNDQQINAQYKLVLQACPQLIMNWPGLNPVWPGGE